MTTKQFRKCCHYLGTEIDRRWWRRYGASGFRQSGIGNYWLDEHGLKFRQNETDEIITISFDHIAHIRIGKWHARRWGSGAPVVKIDWRQDETLFSSGFVFSRDGLETVGIMQKLAAAAKKHQKPEQGRLETENGHVREPVSAAQVA